MNDLAADGLERGTYWDAADLMSKQFPAPRWAVPGVIPEGLTLLAGSPKVGKSWMCLGLAVACATGGLAFEAVRVEAGPVLYCALEDTPRRLQDRLRKVLDGDPVPNALAFVTALPTMPLATNLVAGWLGDHPDARLVVVDVLRKIRPAENATDLYERDYAIMGQLKRVSDHFGVAVVVVHHTRKTVDESDVFNEISGSTGLTGAADAMIVAKKARRNTAEATLHITGREVEETTHALAWDARRFRWLMSGKPPALLGQSPNRQRISMHLADHPGVTPQAIANALDLSEPNVRKTVRRMLVDGELDSDGEGRYFAPAGDVTAVTQSLEWVTQ